MIKGVIVKQLKKIPDERGCIMHMLTDKDENFERFGEIYFSKVNPGAIKAWHLHKKMTLNYAVFSGMIILKVYDDRAKSETKGELQEIFLGDENYCLVKIPPGIWNGFKGLGSKEAIVANCATEAHEPDEIIRKDPFSKDISYDWGIVHR